MTEYRIVDADCHILEPPDIWKNHLGSKWQDKAPKLVKDYEGGDAYYAPPGHIPVVTAGTEMIEFSPTEEYGRTLEVVGQNLEAMQNV